MNNFLGTLGLCRRAGKLLYGFDSVTEEVKNPSTKVAGVIVADDLSEKSKKEVRFICEKFSVPVCEPKATMAEIKQIMGKQTGILAVLDEGLFKSITKSC